MGGYEDYHRVDDRITLYRRNGKPTYYARLRVNGHRSPYLTFSTRTADLPAAIEKAKEELWRSKFEVQQGRPVKSITFRNLWKRFAEINEPMIPEGRFTYIKGVAERYLIEFFGEMNVNDIDDETVRRFWGWRRNYWTSETAMAERLEARIKPKTKRDMRGSRLGNVAEKPSQGTLTNEAVVLKQVLRWAHRQRLVAIIPEVKAPKVEFRRGVKRRPYFDEDECKRLLAFLDEWWKESRNRNHCHQRQMLAAKVRFLLATGLRPGDETRDLMHKDIEPLASSKGRNEILIHVPPHGKVGPRETIGADQAADAYADIVEFCPFSRSNDYVFCNYKGGQVKHWINLFNEALDALGMKKDRNGDNRTLYCLRHSYITMQLRRGVNVQDLARNCGTSPTMIYEHYSHVTTREKAADFGTPMPF